VSEEQYARTVSLNNPRTFAIATVAQQRIIGKIAKEAQIELPEGWQQRLDGGDLIAAVKAAKKTGVEGYQQKLAEAETRAQSLEGRLAEEQGLRLRESERADQAERDLADQALALADAEETARKLRAALLARQKPAEGPPASGPGNRAPTAPEAAQRPAMAFWLHPNPKFNPPERVATLRERLATSSADELAADRQETVAQLLAARQTAAVSGPGTKETAAANFQAAAYEGGLQAIDRVMRQRGIDPTKIKPVERRGGIGE